MADRYSLEDRLNPLFSRWVGGAPGGPPAFASLRLEGLDGGEAKTLNRLAGEAGLDASDGSAEGLPHVRFYAGPGERFEAFLSRAQEGDAGDVLADAWRGQRAFDTAPYVLAEGVELKPGTVQIWGILNVTPDSFSDGGRFFDGARALAQAERMVAEGADVLDVGGESTRPGADPVGEEEELRRVVPIIERLRASLGVPVSVDTAKASVAREALRAGASIVNDVTGLSGDPEMASVVAEAGAGAVLMHMKGTPRTMQKAPRYDDLFGEVARALRRSVHRLERAGGGPALLDPGIGFGKTLAHNLGVIRGTRAFGALGRPVLHGPSRKSFLGALLDLPVEDRLEGTAAAVAAGVLSGARAMRVHDVEAMGRVARVAAALEGSRGGRA
jgi:dihydropteroate synthase